MRWSSAICCTCSGEEAGKLPVFDRKRLMLATALATQPKLLLLDEPVGGLNRTEREAMIQLVRKVKQSGITVLLIEHVMKAVLALANRLLILHHGQKIAEGPPSEVLRDAARDRGVPGRAGPPDGRPAPAEVARRCLR